MAQLVHSKPAARAIIQSRLEQLDEVSYAEWSQMAYNATKKLLKELVGKDESVRILLYRALSSYSEVDLSALQSTFRAATFEIASTEKDAPIPTTTFDYILVPLYGFTTDGFRLGHGGGWYDRVLARQPQALKIGVGFEVNRINFETGPHDIAMDIIVTQASRRTVPASPEPLV